jgi:hypothetical protein
MRTWTRATVPTLCGGCNRLLDKGEPVLVIEIAFCAADYTTSPPKDRRPIRRVRCDRCEGPAPPDLPAFVERSSAITPTPLTKFHPMLPLGTPLADYRARASGEREPGEEG